MEEIIIMKCNQDGTQGDKIQGSLIVYDPEGYNTSVLQLKNGGYLYFNAAEYLFRSLIQEEN
jgi:hypothetical protein